MSAPTKDDFSPVTQTNVPNAAKIPAGHIVVNEKWKNTDLVSTMQSSVNIVYRDRLGIIDFQPSSSTSVIYISEGDLVSGLAYRRKVVKLRKVENVRGIVIVEKTSATNQFFTDLQQFVSVRVGMVVLPVLSQAEAGNLLAQMVHVENRPSLNPLRLKRKPAPIDQSVLLTVQAIPKLGEVKAKALLEKFKSIEGICDASPEDLSAAVGRASAVNIKKFFNDPP